MTVVAPRGPRTPASPPASPHLPRATIHAFALVALPILLAVSVALSLMIGSRPLNAGTVLDVLAGGGSPDVRYLVAELRVPRTAAGLIVGATLGTAGALIQGFTRNPLADPGILGVNAGAAFAIAIGIAVVAGAVTAGHISGGALNPAVVLGGAAVGTISAAMILPYLVAHAVAAVAAASAFRFLNPDDK